MRRTACLLAIVLLAGTAFAQPTPPAAPLMTRWAKDVDPARVLPEYPRPQLVREPWLNLNGTWEFALLPRDAEGCERFDRRIVVPFPVEAALSRVMQPVGPEQRAWYRRTFKVPDGWSAKRVLLHFGAVDWETTVWVNGHGLGTHTGGYDAFSFDITAALRPGAEQELVVAAWDPTDAGTQPRGKQVRQPNGIWYTPTTGIWQTVWLEAVPPRYITAVKLHASLEKGILTAEVLDNVTERPADPRRVEIAVFADDRHITSGWTDVGTPVELRVKNPRAWSPEDPFLYTLRITRAGGDSPVPDQVTSYAGFRDVSIGPDAQGRPRILLNGKPCFMLGLLDQGFWPDGLYTAPTDDALRYDIEQTRALGFNLARKHVKVEPERWYYWCDKLGLLVWQDMPSGDADPPQGQLEIERGAESTRQFELELQRMITTHQNHPCIVMWVPFNEGWGQFDTPRIVDLVRTLDPTRLVNNASGWNDRDAGDVLDIHAYPGPAAPPPQPRRAGVLGEFGGLGLPLAGHTWLAEKSWGYRSFANPTELTDAYVGVLTNLWFLAAESGLSAAVYTQTTDVEIEVNGLMTYDRAVMKMDATRVTAANKRLYGPPPALRVIAPSAQEAEATWRYTTAPPPEKWSAPDFDDSAWPSGPGGFGRDGTPGIVVRTPWETPEIWLRRTINIPVLPANPCLKLYHDEDCEVFLNGQPIAQRKGFVTSYVIVPLPGGALRPGANVLALHCRQTKGGQGIDAGLIELDTAAPTGAPVERPAPAGAKSP